MSIGEVLARLRPDFPDITISKLRFLEAEGLVEPLRAPSGYRKYTVEHVERLRFVLAAQRDRYLPLRVIREQLAALERGERVVGFPPVPSARPAPPAHGGSSHGGSSHGGSYVAPAPVAPAQAVPSHGGSSHGGSSHGGSSQVAPLHGSSPGRVERAPSSPAPSSPPRTELGDGRLSRTELCERSGLDESGVVDLEQYGLLSPGSGGYYGPESLTIASIAARLGEYGLEGRHLRPYRTTADREIGLLAQLAPVLAGNGGSGGREQAMEIVHELAALCAQLHAALVRQGLRQSLGP